MKIAYLDTIGGIAGDMTMAACVSAGVPLDDLRAALAGLSIGGFHLEQQTVRKNGIEAVHLDVVIDKAPSYHRHLNDILSIIAASTIPPGARERAAAIFRVVAAAEATVHGSTLEKVHFHEVGALDSIVDIVGTAICLDMLGIEAVYSSPVKLGSGGTIPTQHGVMPNPAPATVEILKDYPVFVTSIPFELTTPTGAAIVKALSRGVLADVPLQIHRIGYGAGTRDIPEIPNMLRLVVAETSSALETDSVVMVETTIDDMNPQLYPYLLERVLAAGALDAFLTPILMKKGRPGMHVSVLTERARLDAIAACLYRETTTIGLRILPVDRWKLPRRALEISTSFGTVRAKAVVRDGKEQIQPEYEECRRIALERNLSIGDVMRTINRELGL